MIDKYKPKQNMDLIVESLRTHIGTLEDKNSELNNEIGVNNKKIEELKKEIQKLTN